MVAGLETFQKVRALHDSTDSPGEKAAAMLKMQTLARKAGMSVEQAMSTLDAPAPKPTSFFEDLFNTPEFRAHQAERAARYAERRKAAVAEYGSEEAVWKPCEREVALEAACQPIITRRPIINGEMDTLQGWDGGRWERLPPECQQIVANAFSAPASVREAWAEFQFWEKLADDRIAFFPDHDHDVRVRARKTFIEHVLDTMPARSMNDLRCRLSWMQEINDREWNRGNPEDGMLLATLRADIERMGARIWDEAAPVQTGQTDASKTVCSPDPGTTPSPVQTGHARRTNADKRRDVLVLLDAGHSGIHLTDREIARRAGVSPQTVGNIRRGSYGRG